MTFVKIEHDLIRSNSGIGDGGSKMQVQVTGHNWYDY